MTNENQSAMGYDREFYEKHRTSGGNAASAVLEIIGEHLHPVSVVDIGCGPGEWLKEAQQRFSADVLGIDGDWNAGLADLGLDFQYVDLEQPLVIDRTFDLAICLEVAEHLTAEAGQQLITSLTQLSDVVLFSAAVVGQPGVHHINCQWQSRWMELFEQQDFVVFDVLRPMLWDNPEIAWWYRQNIFLAVRSHSALTSSDQLSSLPIMPVTDMVHPAYYEELITWKNDELPQLRRAALQIEQPPSARFLARLAQRYVKQRFHGRG